MAIDWFKLLQKTGSMRRMDFFAEGVVSVFFFVIFHRLPSLQKTITTKKNHNASFLPRESINTP